MKKICAILLSVLMLVSLCVPAGAFELEAVETVKEPPIRQKRTRL